MKESRFYNRHIGPNRNEINKMLSTLELNSLDELLNQTVPEGIRLKKPLSIEEDISENEFLNEMQEHAEKNKCFDTYIGQGYHPTITPAVIKRNILENPGWYTSYTPYQAEIAQGRLEALFNFQSVVSDLTGMEIANASLLDESSAAAEAMTMLFYLRDSVQKKNNSIKFFVSDQVLPQTISVLKTRANPLGIELMIGSIDSVNLSDGFFGVLIQYPGKYGEIINLGTAIKKAKKVNVKVVVAADLLSLTVLEAPGNYDVDVVVGTTQRFGVPLGYGGPHAAYFATKIDYKRNIPGRIIGQTKDIDNNPALRMALQTREQHIKRDRATSNICTAQVLLAVMAGMYAVYHGPKGLRKIAEKIHSKTVELENILKGLGFNQENEYFFDTLKIKADSGKIKKIAEKEKVNFFYVDKETITISLNETVTEKK